MHRIDERHLEILKETVEIITALIRLTPNPENSWHFETACRVAQLPPCRLAYALDFLEKSDPKVEVVWEADDYFSIRRLA